MILPRTFLFATVLLLSASARAQQGEELSTPPLPPGDEQPEVTPPAPEVDRPVSETPPRRVSPRPPKPADAPVGTYSLIGKGEEATVLARGEVVVGQTAHGITQAVLICILVQCNTPQQFAGALLLGGLAGGAGSFLLTSGGISGGPALAMNNGAAWGFAQGALLLGVLGGPPSSGFAGVLSAATAIGTVAGFGIGAFLHPTGGQVAMATSGGIWTGVLLALFTAPFLENFSREGFYGMELAAVNVGLVGFGYLSTKLSFSRGRMFLIDVGGVIGGLVGVAAFLFAGLPAAQGDWIAPTAGVGALAGLAGAVLLTSGIDTPVAVPAELTMIPVGPAGRTGVSIGARF